MIENKISASHLSILVETKSNVISVTSPNNAFVVSDMSSFFPELSNEWNHSINLQSFFFQLSLNTPLN